MEGVSVIKISVIIPVYNDNERLGFCLKALGEQTLGRDQYEIVVVDNGSNTSPQCVLSDYPGVRLIVESAPGSYAARNAGIANANGRYLAFTDADCIPHADWLRCAVEELDADADCSVLIGQVVMTAQNPDRPTSAEIYQMIVGFQQEKLLNIRKYGVTANLVARKTAFETVGYFDSRLKSGGDLEWGRRAYDKGLKHKYAPAVAVDHPARRSFSQLCSQARRVAGGRFQMRALDVGAANNNDTKPISTIGQSIRTLLLAEPDAIKPTVLMRCRALFAGLLVRVCYVLESCRLRMGGQVTR